MSVLTAARRRTTRDLCPLTDDPIVALTAYSAPTLCALDPHCDLLLAGDSVGMVLHGLDSTLAETVDMMVRHGAAVMRGSALACVIVNLPFGSYAADVCARRFPTPEQCYGVVKSG